MVLGEGYNHDVKGFIFVVVITCLEGLIGLLGLYETILFFRNFRQTIRKTHISRFICLFPSYERVWNNPQEQVEYLVQSRYIQSIWFILTMLSRVPSLVLFFHYDYYEETNNSKIQTLIITSLIASYITTLAILLVLHNLGSVLNSIWFKRLIIHYLFSFLGILMLIVNSVIVYMVITNRFDFDNYGEGPLLVYKTINLVSNTVKIIVTILIGWRLSRKLLNASQSTSRLGRCAVFRFSFFILGLIVVEIIREFICFFQCNGDIDNGGITDTCFLAVYSPNVFAPFFLFNFIFGHRLQGNDGTLNKDNDETASNDRASILYFDEDYDEDGNHGNHGKAIQTNFHNSYKHANGSKRSSNTNTFTKLRASLEQGSAFGSFASKSSWPNDRLKLRNETAIGVEMEEVINAYEREQKEDRRAQKGLHLHTETNII